LFLASGKPHALFPHGRLEAIWKSSDEVISIGHSSTSLDLSLCGTILPQAYVLADGAVEEHRFLGDKADLRPQPTYAKRSKLSPIQQDLAASRVIEPLQQPYNSRLPAPRGPHKRHSLASLHSEAEPTEDLRLRPRRVDEVNLHKLQTACWQR